MTIGSPMGVTLQTFRKIVSNVEKEIGLSVPFDVEGADYLLLMSSAEIMQYYEFIGAMAKIFKEAGVTWTFSSDAFEATNSGIQIGSSDLAAELVQRIVDGAEKLKVKYVISPECGHAYTALRWEGPNLIGRSYNFEVLHVLELLDQFRQQGRIRISDKEAGKMSFHDPCQLVRRGGVIDEPRHLLNMVSDDFVEMPDAGKLNWCCGGGGGVSANSDADALRLQAFKVKKQQLDTTGVKKLVTSCSNCRHMLEDGIDEYEMDMEVVGLSELIADHLVISGNKQEG
jgi:Fe-S oxidoreductase